MNLSDWLLDWCRLWLFELLWRLICNWVVGWWKLYWCLSRSEVAWFQLAAVFTVLVTPLHPDNTITYANWCLILKWTVFSTLWLSSINVKTFACNRSKRRRLVLNWRYGTFAICFGFWLYFITHFVCSCCVFIISDQVGSHLSFELKVVVFVDEWQFKVTV